MNSISLTCCLSIRVVEYIFMCVYVCSLFFFCFFFCFFFVQQGHTWSDLQNSQTRMKWPWNLLRSLGLYNTRRPGPGTMSWLWGYDLITNVYMQIANDPAFYRPDSLQKLLEEHGGLAFLPTFLHPPKPTNEELEEDDVWFHYLRATQRHLYQVHVRIVIISSLVYLLVVVMGHVVLVGDGDRRRRSTTSRRSMKLSSWPVMVVGLKSALVRWTLCAMVSYTMWIAAKRHVDSTQWAKDIQNKRLFTSVMDGELAFGDVRERGWTTLPTREDVLIEHRTGGSHYLGLFRDFITLGHLGNARFQDLVQSMAAAPSNNNNNNNNVKKEKDKTKSRITTIPPLFHHTPVVHAAVVRFIFDTITLEQQGRFLEQGMGGNWYLIPRDEAFQFITKALVQAQYPVLRALVRDAWEPLMSELRYGTYRQTALAYRHAAPHLRLLQTLLYANALEGKIQRTITCSSSCPSSSRVRPVEVTTFVSSDGATLLQKCPHVVDKDVGAGRRIPFKKSNYLRTMPSRNVVVRKTAMMSANDVEESSALTTNKYIFSSSSSSSSSNQTTVQEPHEGAWIRTGAIVEMWWDEDELWAVGRVIDVSADGIFEIWHPQDGIAFYQPLMVHHFHPKFWIGEMAQIDLRILLEHPIVVNYNNNNNSKDGDDDDDDDDDDVELENGSKIETRISFSTRRRYFVECMVLAIRRIIDNNNIIIIDNNGTYDDDKVKNSWVADVEFEDGSVEQNINVMALYMEEETTSEEEEEDDMAIIADFF